MKTTKPEFTIKSTIIGGIGIIILGIIFLIIFFPIGIVMIIFGAILVYKNKIHIYSGNCPKCNNIINVSGTIKDPHNGAGNCKFCKARIVLKDGMYEYYE